MDLENKEERNKLIDDFFNKGLECNIKEVYQAVVNTVADLEYANDERIKEVERLNSIIKEVREYIEHENFKRNILVGVSTKKYTRDVLNKILEILDKGSDKE